MREPGLHENPFDLNRASDFSDAEIAEHWVDFSDAPGGLLGILKPTLRLPMLLLGGKGSGKTHLMRYCSAPVQAARRDGSLTRAVAQDGYLGIYVLANALNTDKFSGKGLSAEYWNPIFSMYFELWLATSLVDILRDFCAQRHEPIDEAAFAAGVSDLFDISMSGEFRDVSSLLAYLTRTRKSIDFAVNNSSLSGKAAEITITFSPGRLVFGIPRLIADLVPELAEVLIVYLIDEVENFTEDQQRFLNSLIRYRSGNATIKLGARLYGVKTYETLGSGEPIKRNAEYERVELDRLLREQPREYENLVRSLVQKRLQAFGSLVDTKGNRALDQCFEILDSSNYWEAAQRDLMPHGESDRRRYLHSRLKDDLKLIPGMADDDVEAVLIALAVPDHLFLEKASSFYFRKKWPKSVAQAIDLAQYAGDQARALAAGYRNEGKALHDFISYWGSDILAQLYYDFRRRVPYTGFPTLVTLSQGSPRNLLTNLKHIYRRAQFAGEHPFEGGVISIRSQTDGVRDGASWFWEDAQPGSDGMRVREAVEGIAILFRTVRFGHAPSECDLCMFSVALDELTDNSRKVLRIAENWSYLIRLPEGRRNKNNRRVDEKFRLAPMLAPRWEVSEHLRGSIELAGEFANAILDPDLRSTLPTIFKRRVNRIVSPPGDGAQELFQA
ncbi:MAG: hypothetical protein E6G92_02070 [Alphaproteobacteria bacterium]|nr:MAG: hypothetical protein E6G92_02070 [Alphaproteobacteria bacterium]